MLSTSADPYLVGVEEEESNHEGEQARGFGEGEAKNGVLEELGWSTRPVSTSIDSGQGHRRRLTTDGRVASGSLDQGTEDVSDTDTGTSEADGGETGTVDLGSGHDGSRGRLDDDTAGLHGVAHDRRGEALADEAIAASRLARSSEDGAGDASCGRGDEGIK